MLAILMLALCACGKKKKDKDTSKDKNPAKVENAWENIGDYEINSNSFIDVLAKDSHDKLSAGCYDTEKYAYFVLESDDKTSVICKYDIKDKSLKKTSAPLDIFDVDGICYKKNTLVILHGGKSISIVDSADFEVTKKHDLIFEGVGLAYNKGTDRYTLLLENGGVSVMNPEFEQTFMISGIGSSGENCAVACNNKYIFTIMSAQNGSEIVVYDWSGNYVSTASVSDVRKVPVFVYVDDGDLFIGYDNEKGGAVYITTLDKK